jgi:type IV secretory pathway VirB4 component
MANARVIQIGAPGLMDLALPERIKQYDDFFRIDDTYCCTLVVDALPEVLHMGWFNRIIGLGGVTVSVTNVPNSQAQATEKVSGWMARQGSEYILEEKAGNNRKLDTLSTKYNTNKRLLTDIQMGRNNIITSQITIMIRGRTYKEMLDRKSLVNDYLGSTRAITLYKRQTLGLKAMLPFMETRVPEYHDLTVGNSLCLAPFISADFSHPSGIYFGQNESGSPAFLDLFIGKPRLYGLHMFITGMTRVGKSYTVKGIVARSIAQEIPIAHAVLDPEGEYVKLVNQLGGVLVRFTPGMEVMFNPFDVEPEWDERLEVSKIDLLAKQDDILSLFTTLIEESSGERISAEERALALEAVKLEYRRCRITEDPNSIYKSGGNKEGDKYIAGEDYKEMPTVSSYIKQLRCLGANRLATILLPYTKGHPYGFFDGQSIGRFYDEKLIVFDLSGLNNKLAKKYAYMVMLNWTWEKFAKKERRQRKRVVVDEAWLFMEHPDTAAFLESIARRGSKYNCSLLLASQSFREFLTKEGAAVMNQCDTKYFLKMQQIDADGLGQLFNIPKEVTDKIVTFLEGEGLMQCGRESAILRFVGLPFEEDFLRSDPESVRAT